MEAYPIYVLSLADDVVRREAIRLRMNQLELDYSFIDAIDGRHSISSEYQKSIDEEATIRNLGRKMANAEIATALSHTLLYQKIIDSNSPGAIILEDDAIITDRFSQFINNREYEKCEMILLGYERARVYKKADVINLYDNRRLIQLAASPWLTVGYSISSQAAHELLDRSLPIANVSDWGTDITQLGAYAMTPPIIGHPPVASAQSHIQQQRASVKNTARTDQARQQLLRPPPILTKKFWKRLWFKIITQPIPGSFSVSVEIPPEK